MSVAKVDTSQLREQILNLKMKEFINELNSGGFDLDDVLAGMSEIRVALYDVVRANTLSLLRRWIY